MKATTDRQHRVSVRFTSQQLQLLDRLREEGAHGETYDQVVTSVLRAFLEARQSGLRT